MTDFQSILDEADDDAEVVETTTEQPTAGEVSAVAEPPAPEPTETPDPAPVADEAQPITREDGATWSEKAKRWYLDGKIVAGEAPAPSEPSIPKVETPVAEAPKPETPVAPPAPSYEGEAWQVRGGGQKVTIPGAIVSKDGWVHLSPEHQAQHKALIAAGIEHNTNWQREKQSYDQRVKDAEARGQLSAQKYNKASVYLFDKLAGFLAEHPQELDLIRRELAIELKSADLEIPKAQAAPEPQPEQIEQAFTATLTSYVDELFEDAPKGVLSPEDIKDIRESIAFRMAAYAAEVDGQILLDTHAVKRDFDRELKILQRAQQQATDAKAAAQKAREAAAFNAANRPVTAAPTPRKPSPTPALAAKPSGQKPGWDQSFNNVWKDDGDDE